MMMPGQKGRKSGAGLPAGGFLNLGPAKNMSKKPLFEEKIRGLGMFLEFFPCPLAVFQKERKWLQGHKEK
jgi:hypothetical protein